MTPSTRKDAPTSEVRIVVEVDGNPIGFLNLDIDRLWPLISHTKQDRIAIEWMDRSELDSVMRAAVMKRLISRLEGDLYKTLGDQIVKAQLDVEGFTLKAEAAGQTFGAKKADIERLVAETGRSTSDFNSFFWEYLLDDREVSDLKKDWKAKDTPPR